MNCGDVFLKLMFVDKKGKELDKLEFSKEDVGGAFNFAKKVVGFVPSGVFGNKLDILPLMTICLTEGLGGVFVFQIPREVYENRLKKMIENIKEEMKKEKEKIKG